MNWLEDEYDWKYYFLSDVKRTVSFNKLTDYIASDSNRFYSRFEHTLDAHYLIEWCNRRRIFHMLCGIDGNYDDLIDNFEKDLNKLNFFYSIEIENDDTYFNHEAEPWELIIKSIKERRTFYLERDNINNAIKEITNASSDTQRSNSI